MTELNLPKYTFKITQKDGKLRIFDSIRKKHVVLTPEEWVRQHFIRYITEEKIYPASLLSVEAGLKVNALEKRTDLVVFGKDGKPLMIVECKSPEVEITQSAFDQAARYNMTLGVLFIVVTNGLQHFYCKVDHQNKRYLFLEELPAYSEL